MNNSLSNKDSVCPSRQVAFLALADGRVFQGFSVGADGSGVVGEVVFNTAMTGYQEIMTDPSYAGQIVTFTYPHIGNVGMNAQDAESQQVQPTAFVFRELSLIPSNYRSEEAAESYFKRQNIMAIAGVDTRALTRHIREHGAQPGCIVVGESQLPVALETARTHKSLSGQNLTHLVSPDSTYVFTDASWPRSQPEEGDLAMRPHLVVYDFGVKRQILRLLVDRGCRVTCVPAHSSMKDVQALNPDGILLSNGPGDPASCDEIIDQLRDWVKTGIPLFGICLGYQLLGLAMGASTKKMPFGHHGANHPVQHHATKNVTITSQNHNFMLDKNTLPSSLIPTAHSLFDGTIQGFRHVDKPIRGVQGHPEAAPGPKDWEFELDVFVADVLNYSKHKGERHA